MPEPVPADPVVSGAGRAAPGATTMARDLVAPSLLTLAPPPRGPADRDARDEAARLAAVRRYDVLDTPPDCAFDRIAEVAARVFDVPIAVVSIVDEDRIWFKAHHGLDVEQIDRDPGLCASAIRREGPMFLSDARQDLVAMANPLVAGELGLRFYAAAPLRTPDGHNLGTLCVIDRQPRQVDARELAILEALAAVVVEQLEVRLAARTAVALKMALRETEAEYHLHHDQFAAALRSTLVPPRLPVVSGMDIAACYRPANSSQVGGDFYDVFPLGSGSWGITIGDICGKGPAMAAVAAAARHAVRAAAVDHPMPSRVLSVANEALLMDASDEDVDPCFCTVIFSQLRPYRGGFRLTVSCGGHPPPMIRRASGRVENFGVSGTILGCFPHAPCEDRSTFLRPGDAVVFFTDGLTEAPTGPGMFGREGVQRALRNTRSTTAEQLVRELDLAVSDAGNQRDDVAIIALRVMQP